MKYDLDTRDALVLAGTMRRIASHYRKDSEKRSGSDAKEELIARMIYFESLAQKLEEAPNGASDIEPIRVKEATE